MMFEIKTLPAQEFKVNFDDGTFEGFCAHYGNIDRGGDMLLPGSGKHIVDAGVQVPIFFSHGWKENQPPIGVSLTLEERPDGMWTKGKILERTSLGHDCLVLMDEGAIDCMSIGWNPVTSKRAKTADGKSYREIAKWDILEYSVCPKGFAMNPEAMITKGGPRGIIAKSRWIGNVTDLIDVGGSTSWDSVIDLVMSALRAFYSDLNGHIDRLDISANAVVYNIWDWDGRDEILQMGYTLENGAVTLDGNPRPVDIQVTYVTSGGAPVDVTGDNVDPKDWKGMRAKVHETDPVGLLIDEAAYIHDLAKTLKAEGRDEEVRVALTELASAKSLIEEHLKDAAPAPSLTEQIEKIRAAGERLRQR